MAAVGEMAMWVSPATVSLMVARRRREAVQRDRGEPVFHDHGVSSKLRTRFEDPGTIMPAAKSGLPLTEAWIGSCSRPGDKQPISSAAATSAITPPLWTSRGGAELPLESLAAMTFTDDSNLTIVVVPSAWAPLAALLVDHDGSTVVVPTFEISGRDG
ncbi:hypothetical protein AYL99_05726 [Fonsecaea erecta]|uniref:Uncharacterized protein n=1 Tax=Fonsecaea erecta TaxID=1367422 RepID=A0A178ZLP0_9EURO|nr:hypothetical protein AYL99_05726 [Fonsecaea erecta]OAP60724.1 hypothetical protein AYL99_05726 [Fonsecaea erecta]